MHLVVGRWEKLHSNWDVLHFEQGLKHCAAFLHEVGKRRADEYRVSTFRVNPRVLLRRRQSPGRRRSRRAHRLLHNHAFNVENATY